jgi:hypothetical protein
MMGIGAFRYRSQRDRSAACHKIEPIVKPHVVGYLTTIGSLRRIQDLDCKRRSSHTMGGRTEHTIHFKSSLAAAPLSSCARAGFSRRGLNMTAAEQQISANSATRESTQARATVTDHRPRCGGPSGHGQRRPRLPCRTVDRCRTSLRQAGSARVRGPRLRGGLPSTAAIRS